MELYIQPKTFEYALISGFVSWVNCKSSKLTIINVTNEQILKQPTPFLLMPDGKVVNDLPTLFKTIALVSNAYHLLYGDIKTQEDRIAEGVVTFICSILNQIKAGQTHSLSINMSCLNALFQGKTFWNQKHVSIVDYLAYFALRTLVLTSGQNKLSGVEIKTLDVADLYASCQILKELPRLENLPVFELNLPKKKKKVQKPENIEEVKQTPSQSNSDVTTAKAEKRSKKHSQENKHNNTEKYPTTNEFKQPEDEFLKNYLKVKLVVGEILEAEKHQEADKLLIEKINIGEANPRTICSGIKGAYPDPSVLVGKKVVVFANLPARKMVGVKSEGMLLCAEADNVIKVLEVPQAQVGDVLVYEGATPADFEWSAKKVKNLAEAWDYVAKGLKSDSNNIMVLNGHKIIVNGKEIKAPLPNAMIK